MVRAVKAGILPAEALSSPTRHLAAGPSFRAAMSLRSRNSHELPVGGPAHAASMRRKSSDIPSHRPSGDLGLYEVGGPLSSGAAHNSKHDLPAVFEEGGQQGVSGGVSTPAMRTISGKLAGISGLGGVVNRSKLTSIRRRTEDAEVRACVPCNVEQIAV